MTQSPIEIVIDEMVKTPVEFWKNEEAAKTSIISQIIDHFLECFKEQCDQDGDLKKLVQTSVSRVSNILSRGFYEMLNIVKDAPMWKKEVEFAKSICGVTRSSESQGTSVSKDMHPLETRILNIFRLIIHNQMNEDELFIKWHQYGEEVGKNINFLELFGFITLCYVSRIGERPYRCEFDIDCLTDRFLFQAEFDKKDDGPDNIDMTYVPFPIQMEETILDTRCKRMLWIINKCYDENLITYDELKFLSYVFQ